MSDNTQLFVYGTLMWPEILKAVIDRIPVMEDALLEGYRRLKIKDAVYPALIKAESHSVQGKLIRGLNYNEIVLIDDYEGDEYERKEVFIKTLSGRKEAAFVYVFSEDYRERLLDENWNPSEISEKLLRSLL